MYTATSVGSSCMTEVNPAPEAVPLSIRFSEYSVPQRTALQRIQSPVVRSGASVTV